MKYKTKIYTSENVIESKLVADNPKRAVASAVNINMNEIHKHDNIRVYVMNYNGRVWKYQVKIDYDNHKLDVAEL